MEKCPTCNAKYKSGSICRRCKSDLSQLIELEKQADNHLKMAKILITQNRYDLAEAELKKSLILKNSKIANDLFLYVKAIKGDFKFVIERLMNFSN